MSKFASRSNEHELMDMPIENKHELFLNLSELININKLTGGPSVTFKALKELLKNEKGEIHIADIGFGAGDMLQYLIDHANELPCPIRLTAIDLMPEAFEFANKNFPILKDKVNFVQGDYSLWFQQGNKPDIVLASLFCHHLNDVQMTVFLNHVKANTKKGCIINDLHRSPIAYHGIKVLNALFSKSRFTKNDAPLSVLRGFKKPELEHLLGLCNISNYSIKWKWAFRYLVTIRQNN